MNIRTLLISLLTISGGLADVFKLPVQASASIIKCKGQIPQRVACLIKPSSYKIDTYRVDICEKTPFPPFRSSADYSGAGCLTLFNGNGNLYRGDFARNSNYKPPLTGRENLKSGTYKYLTIVLKNGFTSSGKYTSGETTWRTAGRDKKGRPKLTTKQGEPVEIKESLNNWRGNNNKDNDYCNNNGGTFSRCEMIYNGYKLTGIGLGPDFIENHDKNVAYMFYMVELASPIKLTENLSGNINLTVQRNLEVYGYGKTVKSISTPPFIFEATYTND
tara:strand:+ start:7019 stop:7843 length:825 start_codon:yes stop_codon:yes gene_type:complete